VPASISLKCYTKPRKNAPQRAGRSAAIATNEALLHSSEHPKLDYTAREEEAGGSDALLKHYIGVYNPSTGQLDVMEARRMVVRGSVRAHQAATEEVAAKQVSLYSRICMEDTDKKYFRAFEIFEMILERHSVPRKQRRPSHPLQRTQFQSTEVLGYSQMVQSQPNLMQRRPLLWLPWQKPTQVWRRERL
jgi:hypothetical protein